MEQFYEIAGLKVQMDSFGRTLEQAKPYLCGFQPKADIRIVSNWQEVKDRQPHLTDEHCEYLATGGSFYNQLLVHGGMLLHSSAVVVDGKAFLFSAPRKTGKSTHVQLWLRAFGDRAVILNDDKPALRLENGAWYAYGTPWSGKTGQNANLRVPLAGIAILERGQINRIEPFTGGGAIHALLEQTVRPTDAALTGKLLELLDTLLDQVPMWKLHCNMEPEAAFVAYEAMSGNEKEN